MQRYIIFYEYFQSVQKYLDTRRMYQKKIRLRALLLTMDLSRFYRAFLPIAAVPESGGQLFFESVC